MSKILRRPMFRGGGKVSSYGTGITTGLANGGVASKRGLVDGPGGYAGQKYTSYDKRGMPIKSYTGQEIVDQAKEDYFGSGLIEDTATLGGNTIDLWNKYVNQPFYTITDYALGTDFGKEEETENSFSVSNKYGESQFNKDLFEKKIMPEAYLRYNIQTDQERNRTDQYSDPAWQEKRRLEKINEIDPREAYRTDQYEDGSLKDLLEKQRNIASAKEFEANRVKPGGQDASEADFEVPVGVTEMEGEQEIGFADMAEEYYNMMGAGADERMSARVAAQTEREDERIKRARGTDISNTLLKIFEGSQKEGATVGSSAAEGSKYLTSKESATEAAKRLKESRLDKLEDSSFDREEARRDRAGAMAFKDMMQDKQFDFSSLKSEKDFTNKMEMLKLQLDSADSIAEKRIIAARINTLETIKNKIFAPGGTEKDITWAKKQPKGSFEHTAWLNKNNYASTLEAEVRKRLTDMSGKTQPMSAGEVIAMGTLYYDDWGGKFIQGVDQKDGTYFDTTASEIITIQDGKVVESMTESVKLS